jgi:L-amino acid N-acyltransferase YncA
LVEYVRLEAFDEAELAISVVAGWQRQGVGRQLVRELRTRARAAGIHRFRATIIRGNRGAVALARELGRCTRLRAEGNTVEWIVDL